MAPSGNENYTIVYKGGRYTTNGGLGVDQTTYAATLLSSLLLEHNANKSDDAIGFSLTENGEPLDLSKTGHELSLFTSDNVCTIYALYAAEPNPTISQLFMDGVTYDLKDKNAGSGLPEGGTEGQVLTKTATGTEWKDSEGGMKVFTLANTSDLTTATQAYNYLKNGGICMIRVTSPSVGFLANAYYTLNGWGSSFARFYSSFSSSDKTWNNYYVVFTVSSDNVTSISMYMNTSTITTSLPSSPNANTLYYITA